MVIDTSALLAILFDEPERPALTRALANAGRRRLSVANHLEAAIVVEARLGPEGSREYDFLVDRARLEMVAVDAEQTNVARHGWRMYGKGRHPAGLDYGDCFAYGLARILDEVLLFKGDDFTHTDVTPAI